MIITYSLSDKQPFLTNKSGNILGLITSSPFFTNAFLPELL